MTLTKAEKSFTIIFVIIVLFELFSESLQNLLPFHFAPKPLILASLIIFYISRCKHLSSKTNMLMVLALIFSLTGDVLLMFASNSANFFIGGLVAFLLAHVMYIFVFSDKRNRKPSVALISVLLAYAALLFFILQDGLGNLMFPVIVYMIVILLMTLTASLRKGSVTNISYNMVLIGAVFFMISDSILAINKFHIELPYSHVLIMSTYALAQYLITLGILKQSQ